MHLLLDDLQPFAAFVVAFWMWMDVSLCMLPDGYAQLHVVVQVPDSGDWPVTVELTNGHSHGADLVVCAIGVVPNAGWLPQELERSEDDGGVLVNRSA